MNTDPDRLTVQSGLNKPEDEARDGVWAVDQACTYINIADELPLHNNLKYRLLSRFSSPEDRPGV